MELREGKLYGGLGGGQKEEGQLYERGIRGNKWVVERGIINRKTEGGRERVNMMQ